MTKPLRVLVCGSRRKTCTAALIRRLEELPSGSGDVVLINGGAGGIDAQAKFFAEKRGWRVEMYMAKWGLYGKSAGPIRNQRMLDEGKPDLVLAFPDSESTGTWDMVARASVAGVKHEVHPLDGALLRACSDGD